MKDTFTARDEAIQEQYSSIWVPESSDDEQAFARALLDVDVGDKITARLPDQDKAATTEVVYIDDRPGVREIRTRSGTRSGYYLVVRGKYVFVTDEDREPFNLALGAMDSEHFAIEKASESGEHAVATDGGEES